jgi:hypothetical protein
MLAFWQWGAGVQYFVVTGDSHCYSAEFTSRAQSSAAEHQTTSIRAASHPQKRLSMKPTIQRHTPSSLQSKLGFALIATISVMVLLVMIALAMLSLSTIELRQQTHTGH